MKIIYITFCLVLCSLTAMAQSPAAEYPEDYIPLLKNKNVGLVGNHTSLVDNKNLLFLVGNPPPFEHRSKHLLDVLIENNINVVKIYAPEHGFRGTAAEGEKIDHSVDSKTGTPIISLYGSNKKPTSDQLKGIDYMVFDMQDVGTRFYTYLSTMHYIMEACAENNIPLIVLDRPNPNGFYVDGPILEPEHKSFVGMHPIPIVHGMTLGELAQMINGEGWLKNAVKCDLEVVKCHDYSHSSHYRLPIKPSPNLPNMVAIYLYPSLCLFEGTVLSVGRGTDFPFQLFGHPNFEGKKGYEFTFDPKQTTGTIKPLLNGQSCYGKDLRSMPVLHEELYLDWLIDAYKDFEPKDKFFTSYFNTLSGTRKLRQQIESGKTAAEIKESWSDGLQSFKIMRKKYLLYNE